jgi:uncharacterized membrane protein YhaH (DUF805 family)
MKILDDQFVKNFRVLFRSVISRLIYYISWNKKIRRKEYWANWFWSIAIGLALLKLVVHLGLPHQLGFLLFIYILLVLIAARIARCKDAGLSLWHLLWIFGGSIFGAIIIGILESEKSK